MFVRHRLRIAPCSDKRAGCHCLPERRASGFALIIALVLMGFILLLILSLSALVRVETQATDSERMAAAARGNALLGLQVAVGQLQQLAGADRRVTATADIVANRHEDKQHWLGVWDSSDWDARNPQTRTFLGWLVSGMPTSETATTNEWYELVRSAPESGELIEMATDVRLPKTAVTPAGGGSYAWWIADESTKAKVNIGDRYRRSAQTDSTQEQVRRLLPQSLDLGAVEGVEVNAALAETLWDKADSLLLRDHLRGVDPVLAAEVKDGFHDYTLYGYGLLTDSKRGGLRKNLSYAFLNDAAFNAAFYAVGNETPRVFQPEDYPAALKGNGATFYGPRWEVLRDYFRLPDALAGTGTVPTVVERHGPSLGNESQNPYIDKVESVGWFGAQLTPGVADNREYTRNALVPVVTRMGLYYRFRSEPRGDGNYNVLFEIYPRFTLWNPYNVKLELNGNTKVFHLVMSPSVDFWLTGEAAKNFNLRGLRGAGRDYIQFELAMPNVVLEPGELRVFGMETREMDLRGGGYNTLSALLTPYHAGDAGIFYDITDRIRPDGLGVPSDALLNVRWFVQNKYVSPASTGAIPVVMWTYERGATSPNSISWQRFDRQFMNNASRILHENIPVSGLNSLESIPLEAGGMEWRLLDAGESTGNYSVSPLAHFNPRGQYNGQVGGGYNDYFAPNMTWSLLDTAPAYMGFTNVGGKMLLQGDWGPGHGAGGVSRVVLFDIPREYPVSLGQLQHAAVAPYGHNPAYAVGNSLADPNIAPGLIATKDSEGRHFYDLSWLLNDNLWDRYFFSSKGNAAIDFASGETLPNARLVPLEPNLDSAKLDSVDEAAAHLRIDGAFNVNSTSVKAWSAFLGAGGGEGFSIVNALSGGADALGQTDNPFWRLSNPADNDQYSWYGGFRNLNKAQINELATHIVDEVRERGPFMNLADFVNRRLTANADEGKKGALQAAIDKTTSINRQIVSATGTASASYPEAANTVQSQGANAPGYLTQADILTSVAPFIATRGDTFLIRSYGDAVNERGEVVARCWLEAVVERTPDPVSPDAGDPLNPDVSAAHDFGRKFRIVAFRWLGEDEL